MYTSTPREISGISSGSIDALRVQLMKMNSQQLQAFAQANQDDAIKLGLAAEADKYRKQHAQEAMAMMSGQQQEPPISQQILQSIGKPLQQPQQPIRPQIQGMPPQGMPPQGMPPQQMAQGQMPPQEMQPQGMANGGNVLPEDQGIATLPVGNMDFAEGGIIAFGSGGEVPGYAGGAFMMPPQIPEGAIVMGNMYIDPDTGEQKYLPGSEPTPQSERPFNGASLSDVLSGVKKKADELLLPTSTQNKLAANRQKALEAERAKNMGIVAGQSANLRPTPANDPRLLGATPVAETVAGATPSGVSNPLTATQDMGSPQRGSRLVNPTIPQQSGLASLATKPEDLGRIYNSMVTPAADPFEGRIRNIGEMEQANAAAALAQRRQDIADLGPAYTEREAKLKERQGRIETEEQRLPSMALLEAGLAMMGGTSPHAFVNIGAGGATGVKSYKQGIDKITEARDKLDDAFGRIEEARRSETVLNTKDLRDLENNVRNTVTKTEKDVLAGAQQAYGLSQQQAGKMFDAYITNKRSEFEQNAATNRALIQERGANARAQIGSPLNLYSQLGSAQEGSPLLKGYNIAKNEAQMSHLYESYNKQANDMMAGPTFRSQYPTFSAYVQEYQKSIGAGGNSGFVNQLPGNAPVLKPK
jgi:hypothetical protein